MSIVEYNRVREPRGVSFQTQAEAEKTSNRSVVPHEQGFGEINWNCNNWQLIDCNY